MPNVIIEARIKHATVKALKIEVDGVEHWLPKARLALLTEPERDEYMQPHHVPWLNWGAGDDPADTVLSVPEWLATKAGLI